MGSNWLVPRDGVVEKQDVKFGHTRNAMGRCSVATSGSSAMREAHSNRAVFTIAGVGGWRYGDPRVWRKLFAQRSTIFKDSVCPFYGAKKVSFPTWPRATKSSFVQAHKQLPEHDPTRSR